LKTKEHVDAVGEALLDEAERAQTAGADAEPKPQGVPRVCAGRLVKVLEGDEKTWGGPWVSSLLAEARRAME